MAGENLCRFAYKVAKTAGVRRGIFAIFMELRCPCICTHNFHTS